MQKSVGIEVIPACGLDEVAEEDEAGGGVVEGIVPGQSGAQNIQLRLKFKMGDEVAEAVGGKPGVELTGQGEGVQPGAEAVSGEGTEEAFFSGGTVGDKDAVAQEGLDWGPEFGEGGGVGEVGVTDAVELAGFPGNGSSRLEVGAEGAVGLDGPSIHGDDGELNRGIRVTRGGAGGFEVQSGVVSLIEAHGRCGSGAEEFLHQGAEGFAVGPAGGFGRGCFHDLSHLGFGGGTGFGNGVTDQFFESLGIEGRR